MSSTSLHLTPPPLFPPKSTINYSSPRRPGRDSSSSILMAYYPNFSNFVLDVRKISIRRAERKKNILGLPPIKKSMRAGEHQHQKRFYLFPRFTFETHSYFKYFK
jgi:hypothetical protein